MNIFLWNKEIDKRWNGTLYNMFTPMASLLFANSNAGFPILRKENREHIKLFIQRLKELGCRGVQLDIQFPNWASNASDSPALSDIGCAHVTRIRLPSWLKTG